MSSISLTLILGHKTLLYLWKTGSSQICITSTPLSNASIGDEVDPIKIESRKERAGLGCDGPTNSSWGNSDLRIRNRMELMQKTWERYEKIPNHFQNENVNKADSTGDKSWQ